MGNPEDGANVVFSDCKLIANFVELSDAAMSIIEPPNLSFNLLPLFQLLFMHMHYFSISYRFSGLRQYE